MKRIPVLIPVLILVSALFIGILVYTYVEAKRANPQMIRVGSITPADNMPLSEGGGTVCNLPGCERQPAVLGYLPQAPGTRLT
jgi:hypothetical protein